MIASDQVIRKHTVKLGYTCFCVFPLCNVRTVICNISETENVLDFLIFFVCNDPIVKSAVVVSTSVNVIFNEILCISDYREGICIIVRTVIILFNNRRCINGRIGYIHRITVSANILYKGFCRLSGKIIGTDYRRIVKIGTVSVYIRDSLCIERIGVNRKSCKIAVEIILVVIGSVISAEREDCAEISVNCIVCGRCLALLKLTVYITVDLKLVRIENNREMQPFTGSDVYLVKLYVSLAAR